MRQILAFLMAAGLVFSALTAAWSGVSSYANTVAGSYEMPSSAHAYDIERGRATSELTTDVLKERSSGSVTVLYIPDTFASEAVILDPHHVISWWGKMQREHPECQYFAPPHPYAPRIYRDIIADIALPHAVCATSDLPAGLYIKRWLVGSDINTKVSPYGTMVLDGSPDDVQNFVLGLSHEGFSIEKNSFDAEDSLASLLDSPLILITLMWLVVLAFCCYLVIRHHGISYQEISLSWMAGARAHHYAEKILRRYGIAWILGATVAVAILVTIDRIGEQFTEMYSELFITASVATLVCTIVALYLSHYFSYRYYARETYYVA